MAEETDKATEQDRPQTDADAEAAGTGAEATETEEAALPDNAVTVEDIGTLKKKVTVQVDRRRIDAKFDEMFGELGQTAQVPGFRIGRAPRRLIEKRFGKEVSEDVRNAIVGEAVGQALEQADFRPLGEPEITLDEIKLPENDDMTFSFEVEAAPEFDLPEYKGIEITRPVIEVTDERVEDAMRRSLHNYGRLKPIESPAEADDLVIADVTITGDGLEHKTPNVELRVAPAQVEGIVLEELPKILSGKKTGQSADVTTTVSTAHPNEDWREKEVTVTFDIKEVKRLELPELDEDYARRVGFESLAEMRESVRARFKAHVSNEQQRAMHKQVCEYLMANTSFDLPVDLTKRHAERLLARRCVDMMSRGVPREQIERDLQILQTAASEQAVVDMRLSFILGKLAQVEGIEVDDGEINARIAQIAAQYNRRPERIRQEMTNEGILDQVVVTIREEKAIGHVLEAARITDAAEKDTPADEASADEEPKETDSQDQQ